MKRGKKPIDFKHHEQIELVQKDIRNVVENWPSETPETQAGDRFSQFVSKLDWDTY